MNKISTMKYIRELKPTLATIESEMRNKFEKIQKGGKKESLVELFVEQTN